MHYLCQIIPHWNFKRGEKIFCQKVDPAARRKSATYFMNRAFIYIQNWKSFIYEKLPKIAILTLIKLKHAMEAVENGATYPIYVQYKFDITFGQKFKITFFPSLEMMCHLTSHQFCHKIWIALLLFFPKIILSCE